MLAESGGPCLAKGFSVDNVRLSGRLPAIMNVNVLDEAIARGQYATDVRIPAAVPA